MMYIPPKTIILSSSRARETIKKTIEQKLTTQTWSGIIEWIVIRPIYYRSITFTANLMQNLWFQVNIAYYMVLDNIQWKISKNEMIPYKDGTLNVFTL